MWLVFGGAAQGKLDYAKSLLRDSEYQIFSLRESNWPVAKNEEQILIVCELEAWVEAMEEKSEEELMASLEAELAKLSQSPLVLIMEERGCGIVPLVARERSLRERCGIVLRYLAERAKRVDRVMAAHGICLKEPEAGECFL